MKSQSTSNASPQEQLPPIYVSLKELLNERHKYTVFPPFQRQQVWPIRKSQALIDTILLGDPVTPIEGWQEFTEHGEVVYPIIDGHQRITTILDFMDGKFKTWTVGQKSHAEPNSKPPVEPGRYFDELSVIARNYFYDFRIQINRVRHGSDEDMVTRFLRIQNHVPLSAAEKLNAYVSKAKDAAKRIEQHLFWEDFYEGKADREQIFQSSLYLLAIEMSPNGILDLQSGTFMNGLASGKRDDAITYTLADTVLKRLDDVCVIFEGTNFTTRALIVPMYQSVLFLNQQGYTIQPKDKGRLTNWIGGISIATYRGAFGVSGFHVPAQKLLRESAQNAFWKLHRKTVMTLFGVKEAA